MEEKVLLRIKPTDAEIREISNTAETLRDTLESISKGRFEPLLVGSVPKGTFLRSPDIDVFLMYPTEVPKEVMAEETLALGRKVLDDPVEKYAEHPYINGKYKGYNADIVPCYQIDDIDDMLSSVDRTPLHTEYVIKNLPENKRDDVLLLKAFLKGIGAYGAHAQVKGFSGYLCELMVLHYGSFEDTLKEVSGWSMGETVEMVTAQRGFDEALIFVDPVDPKRNVASAVDEETMSLFIFASKTYFRDPKLTYFFPNTIQQLSMDELTKVLSERGTELILLSFHRPNIIDENLYPQVEKACRKLHEHMEMHDFNVLHSGYNIDDDISIVYELEHKELSNIKIHRGPPVFNENALKFHSKYGSDVYIEGHRLMTDRDREYKKVSDLMNHLVKTLDMGSDLNDEIKDGLMIFQGEDAIAHAPEPINLFFDRRFSWER